MSAADDLRTDLDDALRPYIADDISRALAVGAAVERLVRRWAAGELRAAIDQAAETFVEVEGVR